MQLQPFEVLGKRFCDCRVDLINRLMLAAHLFFSRWSIFFTQTLAGDARLRAGHGETGQLLSQVLESIKAKQPTPDQSNWN